MARVHFVKRSRKVQICSKTGHEIPVGSPYRHASPGFRGRRIVRCMDHPFRPSDLTTGVRAEALVAIEAFESALEFAESFEELESAWEELGSELEQFTQTREDALDAWPNGNSQLEELRDQAQEAQDAVQSHYIESKSEDDLEGSEIEARMESDELERDEAVRELIGEALDEAKSECENIVNGLDL